MPILLRRFLLWTVLCSVSAAPSFYLASRNFNHAAMIVGVCLFIVAYTACTSTKEFERLHRRPFVRSTLYIGYGFRLALSLIFPIGLGGMNSPHPILLFLWADIWPGILSVQLVQAMGFGQEGSFGATLATTIVQGALLNCVIFLLMLIVYWFQRLFMTPPPHDDLRGFDVIVPAMTETKR